MSAVATSGNCCVCVFVPNSGREDGHCRLSPPFARSLIHEEGGSRGREQSLETKLFYPRPCHCLAENSTFVNVSSRHSSKTLIDGNSSHLVFWFRLVLPRRFSFTKPIAFSHVIPMHLDSVGEYAIFASTLGHQRVIKTQVIKCTCCCIRSDDRRFDRLRSYLQAPFLFISMGSLPSRRLIEVVREKTPKNHACITQANCMGLMDPSYSVERG